MARLKGKPSRRAPDGQGKHALAVSGTVMFISTAAIGSVSVPLT